MLRIVGEKAAAAGLAIQRLKANLVNLSCLEENTFDYAACLFSTLGMVAGAAERERVTHQVFRLLKPGGIWVVHVHNRWFNVWDPQARWWLVKDWLRSLWFRRSAGDHVAPIHQGIAGLQLHLFTRREARRLLQSAGFEIMEVQSLGLHGDGKLRYPWWLGQLRSYGYLFAARKP